MGVHLENERFTKLPCKDGIDYTCKKNNFIFLSGKYIIRSPNRLLGKLIYYYDSLYKLDDVFGESEERCEMLVEETLIGVKSVPRNFL